MYLYYHSITPFYSNTNLKINSSLVSVRLSRFRVMFCTHISIGQVAAERSEGGPDSLKHSRRRRSLVENNNIMIGCKSNFYC